MLCITPPQDFSLLISDIRDYPELDLRKRIDDIVDIMEADQALSSLIIFMHITIGWFRWYLLLVSISVVRLILQ